MSYATGPASDGKQSTESVDGAEVDVAYDWFPGRLVAPELLDECVTLYSEHYGQWGPQGARPGKPVRLTSKRAAEWLRSEQSNLSTARDAGGRLIGYAIIVEFKLPRLGLVSWVSQLVVHADFRNDGVAKRLLFASWRTSGRYAWGVVTANPYAVRALEKATRRRTTPKRISRTSDALLRGGATHVPYVAGDIERRIAKTGAAINTKFFLDHSEVAERIARVVSSEKPWLLGTLEEGWEWFAFTFADQPQIGLSKSELDEMLDTSDQITRQAYARMALDAQHKWMQHTESEVEFAIQHCAIKQGSAVLDFGCGNGRHAHALAKRGIRVVGVDYSRVPEIPLTTVGDRTLESLLSFKKGDCRSLQLGERFDAALCLYDVVGSFAHDSENRRILTNLAAHLRSGALVLISVMNMAATLARRPGTFDLQSDPDRLLSLVPSNTMEASGDIFDPEHMLVDVGAGVVYRVERFERAGGLKEEMLVRDRRYTLDEIEQLCKSAGLEPLWSRHVAAGKWETPKDADVAKEILLLCRRIAE